MDSDEQPAESDWSGLTVEELLTAEGLLRGAPLFERAGIPDVALPAEDVIERLAEAPSRTDFGRVEVLDAIFAEAEDRESALSEIIADAARKLGTLDWVLEDVFSDWQMSRWALAERLSTLERETLECRSRLEKLPDVETAAPKLQRAGRIAQEEFAGLIALLDRYRLELRRERLQSPHEDTPAFASSATVLRILETKAEQENDRKAA